MTLVYVYAAIATLLITGVAIVVPIWARGGMEAVTGQLAWLGPTFLFVFIFLVGLASALASRQVAVVDLALALMSTGMAIVWLRAPAHSRIMRIAIWSALILAILIGAISVWNLTR